MVTVWAWISSQRKGSVEEPRSRGVNRPGVLEVLQSVFLQHLRHNTRGGFLDSCWRWLRASCSIRRSCSIHFSHLVRKCLAESNNFREEDFILSLVREYRAKWWRRRRRGSGHLHTPGQMKKQSETGAGAHLAFSFASFVPS